MRSQIAYPDHVVLAPVDLVYGLLRYLLLEVHNELFPQSLQRHGGYRTGRYPVRIYVGYDLYPAGGTYGGCCPVQLRNEPRIQLGREIVLHYAGAYGVGFEYISPPANDIMS